MTYKFQTVLTTQPTAQRALVLVIVYFLLAVGCMALPRLPGNIAGLWFANAAAIVILHNTAGRAWLGLLLLAGLTNVITNLCWGRPLVLVSSFLPGNLLEIALGSFFLNKVCSPSATMVNPLELAKTLLLVGIVPVLMGSLMAALVLSAHGLAAFDDVWLVWLEAGVVGSLATLPLGMVVIRDGSWALVRKLRNPRWMLAPVLMMAATALVVTQLPFPWIYITAVLVALTLTQRWTGMAVGALLSTVVVAILWGNSGPATDQYLEVSRELRFFVPMLIALLMPLLLACVMENLQVQKNTLIRTQRRLNALYEKTPAMLHALEPDGTVRFVSDRWLERMGYARNAVVGHKVFEFMPPEEAQRVQTQAFPQFMQTGKLQSMPMRLQTQSVKTLHVEVSAVLLDSDAHSGPQVLSVLEEVAERNQARQRAEQQTQLMEDVIDSVTYGLVVFDKNRFLRFKNSYLNAILRVPDELFKRKDFNFSDLVSFLHARGDYGPDRTVQEVLNSFMDAMQSWKRLSLERRQPDGSYITVEAIPLANGWVVLTYQDITARRLEQLALQDSKVRTQLATQSSGLGLWEFDLARRGFLWDAQQYRLYGLEPQAEETLLNYEFWAQHLHADDRASTEAAYQQAIDTRSQFEAQFRILWPDGSVRYIKALGRPRLNATGEMTAMLGTNRDTTDEAQYTQTLKAARNAARDAAATKSLFLANMSHELRTPMNAVLGLLELLGHTALTSAQIDYVEKIEGAARSLLGLLNDILDFSKIEAGKLDLDIQPFALETLLGELAVVLSSYVGRKPVDVLYDIDTDLPAVCLGDALRIKQVLINLAGNAIKFTETGQVVVALRRVTPAAGAAHDPGSVEIAFSVTDSGIGIAPENIPKMFQSFSQAEASTTRNFGGTGLGLAISKTLVERMGGQIALTSVLQVGTTFSFSLPLGVPAQTSTVLEAARTPMPPASQHVLLVDDNPVATAILAQWMLRLGWTVDLAHSATQGTDRLGAALESGHPYSMVFIDAQLAPQGGWDLFSALRHHAKKYSLVLPKFVIVSANGSAPLDQRSDSEREQLHAFLVKPLTPARLLDAAHAKRLPDNTKRRTTRSHQRALAGMRILVVDDNALNQQVAEGLLSAQGAHVALAADGKIAVAAVAATKIPFDVVLMDVQMPVMDGFEATYAIRNTLQLVSLPIVGLTANAMASDRDDCLRAGMNAHIGKPFDLAQLVALILGLVADNRVTNAAPVSDALPAGSEGHATDRQLGKTAPQTQAAALAALGADGTLDVAGALERMGGMDRIYIHSARDLLVVLPTFAGHLDDALHAGDLKRCAMMLHTLRGNASTLGLPALANQLAAMERLCKPGTEVPEYDEPLANLTRCIDISQVALGRAVQLLEEGRDTSQAEAQAQVDTATTSHAATPTHRADIQAARDRLMPLLADEDFTALEVYAQDQAVWQTLPAPFAAPLAVALQNLEWDTALQILVALEEPR